MKTRNQISWMIFFVSTLIIVLFLSNATGTVSDGMISGHVYDAATKQPLSQAFVYCQEIKCSKPTTNGTGYYATDPCFSPSQTYTIQCTRHGYKTATKSVTTDQDGKAIADFYLELISANQPPYLVKFIPINYPSPQESGTYPDFYVEAIDPDGDSILYMFVVDGQPLTKWTKNADWKWGTSDNDVGTHTIQVRIRDGQHASENNYDDQKSIQFDIYKGEVLQLPSTALECDEKGRDLYYKSKYDDAIHAFGDAIRLDPSLAQAWQHKGWALRMKGDNSEALNCLNEATRLNPTVPEAWMDKGYALADLGKYDKAIQAFNESIRLNPKYMGSWYGKGLALRKWGKNDEAINVLDEIIILAEGQYAGYKQLAYDIKGAILEDSGKHEEAVRVFEKEIEIYPENEYAWYNKGKALKAQGRNTEADEAFAKAKELGYDVTSASWISR